MLRLFFIRSKLTPPSAYPEQKPAEPESGGSAKETERRPKARGIEAEMSGRRKGGAGQSGSFAGWKSREAANCSGKPGAHRRCARARKENSMLYKLARMCYFLTAADIGKKVILNGWVFKLRNHGGLFFINLRDRFGVTQTVIDDGAPERLRGTAASLKFECCIAVCGTVRQRPDSMVNPQMATGEIEVAAEEIVLLNSCDTLPFMIDEEETQAKEDLRLRYRFLDLRSGGMQSRIALRHKTAFAVREFLNGEGFFEIETPTFIKSTPEGARDFLVPSRIHKGKFYALPQSPQLYKQLLMVSGFDKYFQIARCYRDEDARGDRQPEFTQIDMEMSFVSAEDVYSVTERMMKHVFRQALNVDLPTPFPRIPYSQAMNLYGSDKPDLRFGMTFTDPQCRRRGRNGQTFDRSRSCRRLLAEENFRIGRGRQNLRSARVGVDEGDRKRAGRRHLQIFRKQRFRFRRPAGFSGGRFAAFFGRTV